jgi:hypothetical protein
LAWRQACILRKSGAKLPFVEIRNSTRPIFPASRTGATLTEVLIALLIMSIGLVALAVLFPISVLRSIKAAQFTTATDARYNAEAAIDTFPRLIRDPAYVGAGTTGTPAVYWGRNYIIDPLGFAEASIPAASPLSSFFGNDSSLPASPQPGSWPLVRYFGLCSLTAPTVNVTQLESAADAVVTMPDSWLLQLEGLRYVPAGPAAGDGSTQVNVTGLAASGVTFPPAAAVGMTQPNLRALIFSRDGKLSQAEQLTGINGDTITWNAALPVSLTANGIGKVRIEWQERRYTWLLTVRMDAAGNSPSVDVVVFFLRKFDPLTDELLYPAVFTANNTQVQVTFPAGSAPFMHKGNYIFDANNAFWYRVTNVIPQTSTSALVVLDVPANATNTNVQDPNAALGVFQPPRAMFPRNIVDVYPIGTK